MLTDDQRDAAQRRWIQRLEQIEVATGVSLASVVSKPQTRAANKVAGLIQQASKKDDPQAALATLIPEIRAIFSREFGREEVVSGVAGSFREARASGLAAGAREGVARVQQSTLSSVPVSETRLENRRERLDRTAEPDAAAWTNGVIDAGSKAAMVQALVFVGTAVDIVQVATMVEKAVAARIAGAARNEVTNAAREGVTEAFRENGQEGWVWIAEDDACDFCWGMSGLVFPIDDEMESHPNCRCSQEPVEDINDPAVGFDPTTVFNDLTQPEQVAVLGREGQEQYARGEVSLREIAQQRGGFITTRQLSRDIRRQEVGINEHLPGYEDLPGAPGRLPAQVQDALVDKKGEGAGGRGKEWLDHVNSDKYGDPYFRTLTTGMGVDNGPRISPDKNLAFFKEMGEIEIFRGVSDEAFAREFLEGASNPGRGMYGSGYYASSTRATAESYAGDGALIRMTIASDARIVDWDEMVKVIEPSTLENAGFANVVKMSREMAGVAPLPFEPSDAVREMLSPRDLQRELRDALLKESDAEDALISAWNDAVGDDLWSRLYNPEKQLSDQPILTAVANKSFTVPGVKIPAELRQAAQDYVNAADKYSRARRAAENAPPNLSSTVKTEGDAIIGSTPALLSGYDVIRVQNNPSEQFYIILNRDVIRASDTIEVKRNGEWVKERIVKNEEDRIAEHVRELVDERVTRAEKLRDTLDEEMQDIARRLGAQLDGLAYSVKGRDSMERKVRTKMLESRDVGDARSAEEIIAEDIRDANRYTMIVNTESYGDDVARFVSDLRSRGYSFSDDLWRNTWSKVDEDGNPRAYRGLNVNMRSPDGDLIEIQFHTKESFATKQKNHKMYEEQRLPETSAERKAELAGRMAANMDSLPDPVGWDEILTVPGGSFAPGTSKPSEIVERFAGARGTKKDAADGIDEVFAALDEFMQLPPSRNASGKINIFWGGQKFTKKDLQSTVAYYQRWGNRQTGKYVKSEIGISGSGVKKEMTRREAVEDLASTFVHEFGHMVEGELFGSKAAITRNIDNVDGELYDWFRAVSSSKMAGHWRETALDTLQDLGLSEASARRYYDYYMSPEELWARSFAQWFARRTGGKVYTEEALRAAGPFKSLVANGLDPHWAPDDFDEIAEAFDKLFREKGWML